MDYGHPLRTGAFLTPVNADPHVVRLARLAEDLGYDLVALQDHPYQPRFHETWTLLTWVAAKTSRIRVATSVLNTPMRPPAVLARAAASLDLLSRGRLELGLGAGFFWDAMTAMGVPRLGAGESVDALAETIDVVRGMWDAAERSPLHHDGVHHRISSAARGPAPAHDVPVWVGGGRPRMLRLVGRQADGWVAPGGTAAVGTLPGGNAAIDDAAVGSGRDPREIRRALTIAGRFTTASDGFLAGPPAQWVDQLLPLVLEAGVSTFLLASDDEAVLRRFADDVAPALRERVGDERARRGVAVGTVRRAAVRARRRAGIDYGAVPADLTDRAVEPGDAAYATVRSTYMRGGSPGLVLRPRTTGEVASALTFARTHDVPLSIRSGGHGISGRSTNDGGIVVDLSALDDVTILDRAARLVRVGAGARWGEVAAALQPRGWAITSGDYGGVGVGGLATAGGIGFLGRRYGLTIDHVRAAEVVLADGSVVRASERENPDLFWAVRGAGSAVGVVTALDLVADEVGDVAFAQLVLDASDTADFLVRWGAAVEASPRDLTSFLIMGRPQQGRVVAQTITVVDSDDPDVVLARLQPFAGLGPLLEQAVQVAPYSAVVSPPEPGHDGRGEPVSRNGFLRHITEEFADDAARLVRSGQSYFFQIRALGGATADVEPGATAFAHRDANFNAVAFGASQTRLDEIWDRMHHHFSGIYVSFETDRRPERLLDAYPPATLERLLRVKRRYDPGNVFRDNVDLSPAGALQTPAR